MAILNQFYNGHTDEALVKALQVTPEPSIFTKAACACVLFVNDMKHVHLHASGEDFDKIHDLCQAYYDKGSEESDYLAELAMEMKEPVPNFRYAGDYVSWKSETAEAYDYAQCLNAVGLGIGSYVNFLSDLRNTTTTTEDMKSKLDDMIREWKKELDYKIKYRMEGTEGVNSEGEKP